MVYSATIELVKARIMRGIHYGYGGGINTPAYHLDEKPLNSFVLQAYKSFSSLYEGQAVLDLGCGPGRFVRYAPKERRWYLIGFDYDPEALTQARQLLSKGDRVIRGDLTQSDMLANLEDAPNIGGAVSFRVLHGLPGLYHRAFMERTARLLPSGGKFFISFACADTDWKAKLLREQGSYKPADLNDCKDVMFTDYGIHREEPFLIHFLSGEEFKGLAVSSGFKVIRHSVIEESSGYSHLEGRLNSYQAFELEKV